MISVLCDGYNTPCNSYFSFRAWGHVPHLDGRGHRIFCDTLSAETEYTATGKATGRDAADI